jgi:MBG domain-containing protein
VITWPKPAGIVYGASLGASQLNATADVPGTFTYTPGADTILNAGAGQTLSVHFRPDDTRNYNDAGGTTTLDVAKAKQTIVWAAPAPIVYGTPLSAAQLNARSDVVGPSPAGAVTYTPPAGTILDAGTHTLTVDAAETPNYEPATATVTLQVNRAPLSLVVDAKSKRYGAALPVLTGVLTGIQNKDPITPSYATVATQESPTGVYPITATLLDPSHRLVNYDVTITPSALTIHPAPLLIAANAVSKQYSDPVPLLTATYTGFVLAETPAVLSGVLSIQTTAERLSPPGTYPITIGGLTSTNYAITYAGAMLTVLPEDARLFVISPLFVAAAPNGPTTITMAATIRDISATADANGDMDSGDIRKATLSFVDRATNTVLCTPAIGLSSVSDQRVGIATCTFTRDFGAALPASLVIGARVSSYYTRDDAADDATLAVVTPSGSFVASARIGIASPAGPYGPGITSTPQFELNLHYDNKGVVTDKLSLAFTRVVDGVERQYELTASSVRMLSVRNAGTGLVAAVIGAGTLVDLTNKQSPLTIAANAPLVITATDAGSPNTSDSISFTLYKPDGGLWMATGWDGNRAAEQPLQQGSINIKEK